MTTIDLATSAQRERAIRALWVAYEFDTATIAALLGLRESEVARVVAERDAPSAPASMSARPKDEPSSALPTWSELPEAARTELVAATRRELEDNLLCLAGDVACRFYDAVRVALPHARLPILRGTR